MADDQSTNSSIKNRVELIRYDENGNEVSRVKFPDKAMTFGIYPETGTYDIIYRGEPGVNLSFKESLFLWELHTSWMHNKAKELQNQHGGDILEYAVTNMRGILEILIKDEPIETENQE